MCRCLFVLMYAWTGDHGLGSKYLACIFDANICRKAIIVGQCVPRVNIVNRNRLNTHESTFWTLARRSRGMGHKHVISLIRHISMPSWNCNNNSTDIVKRYQHFPWTLCIAWHCEIGIENTDLDFLRLKSWYMLDPKYQNILSGHITSCSYFFIAASRYTKSLP